MSMLINPYRFGVSGGGGFTNPPAFWYDHSDLGTLFQDAAGTTPVTANGDPVGLIVDKSGNGRNFTASGTQRPTYGTDGTYHWLYFDGGDRRMYGSTSMLAFSDISVFIGYKLESGATDFGSIIGQPQDTTHVAPFWRWNVAIRNTGGFEIAVNGNGSRNDYSVDAAAAGNNVFLTAGITSMYVSGSQNQIVVRANGVPASNIAGTQSISYPNAVAPVLGNHIGGEAAFKGRIYGIVGYSSPVTSQAWIDEVEAWVNSKVP